MSVILHRFPLSHFSEKGRALLDFKELDYTLRDYTLGLPQRQIVKLSGQRKVPVIEHDGLVIHDSTRIAHYLDDKFPERRRLIPEDEPRRSEVLALEDRIDRTLGVGPVIAWAEHCLTHRDHLDLLAIEIHGASVWSVRAAGAAIGLLRRLGAGRAVVDKWLGRTRKLLGELVERLERSPYLCGDQPTLADIAAVGLVFHLEFPKSRYLAVPDFALRGVPAFTEEFAPFFAWRRRFYETYLH